MLSLCLSLLAPASALVASAPSTSHRCAAPAASRSSQPVARASSRREALSLGAAAAALLVAAPPRAAFASQDPNDMGRFKKGLEGVNYLLDNWDKETTECTTEGEAKCKDTPDKVRFYFGLRTVDHPLFALDKLFAKAQDKLPDDVDFETWIQATEDLASQIAKINELAYTCVFCPAHATAPPLPPQCGGGCASDRLACGNCMRAQVLFWRVQPGRWQGACPQVPAPDPGAGDKVQILTGDDRGAAEDLIELGARLSPPPLNGHSSVACCSRRLVVGAPRRWPGQFSHLSCCLRCAMP